RRRPGFRPSVGGCAADASSPRERRRARGRSCNSRASRTGGGAVKESVRKWETLAVVGTAFFMTILALAIVTVPLPSIQKDLDIPESTLQWVVTAYAITFGGFLLLGGRMAD